MHLDWHKAIISFYNFFPSLFPCYSRTNNTKEITIRIKCFLLVGKSIIRQLIRMNTERKKHKPKTIQKKSFSLLFLFFVMIECNVHTVQTSVKHCRYEIYDYIKPLNFLSIESKKFMGFHEMFADLFRPINRFRFSFNSWIVNLYFVLVCVFCLSGIVYTTIYKFLFIVTAPHGDRFRNNLINVVCCQT